MDASLVPSRRTRRAHAKTMIYAAPQMPLDPAFVADCPYGPEGLLIDEILEIRKEDGFVAALMPTHDDLPLTCTQRVHPVRHPRHVSGGLMVHMTGMVAFVHAYYVLELRHADGWVGYGARIRSARFHALARPGEPLRLTCKPTQLRRGDKTVLARYSFEFFQGDTLVYDGDQTALWTRVEGS
jgi:3-hydroxymyristoyl/3-hydroxydecanoyl-(acyl carrier protein) dehydratase